MGYWLEMLSVVTLSGNLYEIETYDCEFVAEQMSGLMTGAQYEYL